MSWPRVRGSPAERRESACRVRAACIGDAGGDGEQGGEVAHGVRGRAEADVPFGGGVGGTLGDRPRVAPVGCRPGGGDDGPVPGAVEGPGVSGQLLVHRGTVGGGQAGRLADQKRRAPFVELPFFQRGQGAGHFGDQGLGQAQEPAALGRGFPPCQGDLRAHAGPELLGRHPGVGLFAALQQVKGDGQTCLTGSQGRLSVFEGPDFCNQPCAPARRPCSRLRPGHLRGRHACRLKCVGPKIAVHGIRLSVTCDNFRLSSCRQISRWSLTVGTPRRRFLFLESRHSNGTIRQAASETAKQQSAGPSQPGQGQDDLPAGAVERTSPRRHRMASRPGV